MVHHTYKSKGDHPDHNGYVPSSGYAPRRATFQHDNHSAFERDRNPTVSPLTEKLHQVLLIKWAWEK